MEQPLPTSPDPRRATDNFTARGLWAIRTTTGREVAAPFPVREVVLLPGTELVVLARSRFEELPVTILVEGEAGTDNRRAVATEIRRARSRPDVVDPDSGRYATDLLTSRASWDLDLLRLAGRSGPPLAAGDTVALRFVDEEGWQDAVVTGRHRTGARAELVVEVAGRGELLVARADGTSWDAPPEREVPTRVTDRAGAPHRRAWLRPPGRPRQG